MEQRDILRIAMEQSARDLNSRAEDFLQTEYVITPAGLRAGAKRYYQEPMRCNFVSFGSNIVASVEEQCRPVVEAYLHRFICYHCFETPSIHWLDEQLAPYDLRVCFMAEYFLPELDRLQPLPCRYRMRLMGPEDFRALYLPEWGNALCRDRKELDVLGIGAYDGDRLIGLAACSADADDMWQIGVDVLPEYRRQGIASALTSRLALEILDRDKVPFYCCAWSNVRSARNAVKSGFSPAWAEMTLKPVHVVDEMNQGADK